MISDNQKHIILATLSPFHPIFVGIFGSYARDEDSSTSDLDILVDFEKTVNLLDLIGLELDLSEKLGIKVDLITRRAVPPELETRIENDMQLISMSKDNFLYIRNINESIRKIEEYT